MGHSDQVQIQVPNTCNAIRVARERFEFLEGNNIIGVKPHQNLQSVELRLPEANDHDSRIDSPNAQLQSAIDNAQKLLVENISKSANTTLKRIGQSFSSYLAMNAVLFLIGVGGFVAAIIKGFTASGAQDTVITAVFGGLSATAFITLFIAKPLEETASAGPEAAWLLSAINTYWTKLVYLDDQKTFVKDIEMAQRDFERAMKLFTQATNYMGRLSGTAHDVNFKGKTARPIVSNEQNEKRVTK
jgi:hypothetical protein